ncbi:MAG: alpha/beta hydrolase [Chloroflexi bacterium]|nr:alpha/beta hydrolase [Chloroflexota bacterium]
MLLRARNHMLLWLVLVAASLMPVGEPALVNGPTLVASQVDYEPVVVWDTCPFPLPRGETEGVTIDCGYLIVPQDRAEPGGVEVELAVAILYSTGPTPAPDPILYLEGGPGGSALTGVDAWAVSVLRTDRDIILIDQRGTGYSWPWLTCYEVDEIEDELGEAAALTACRQRLAADGIDVSDYNSANSAKDVADLRVALEIDEWNLVGISYGTRLALTIMRDYPEGVRSVILDSAYPPVVDAYEQQAVASTRVFNKLFTDCATDPACSAAYPDLEGTFYRVLDALDADPLDDPDLDGLYYGGDLVMFMFDLFYDANTVPYMPRMIAELDQGETATFLDLYWGELPPYTGDSAVGDDLAFRFVDEFFWLSDDFDDATYNALWDDLYALDADLTGLDGIIDTYFEPESADYLLNLLYSMDLNDRSRLGVMLFVDDVSDADGMFNAVECNEEVPFNDLSETREIAATLPTAISEVDVEIFVDMLDTCAAWNAGVAADVEDDAVYSDIPTLVLAGAYDPVTPPEWGMIAVSTLSNGYFFLFPAEGHSVLETSPCADSIVLSFLDAPLSTPDATCLMTLDGITFETQ